MQIDARTKEYLSWNMKSAPATGTFEVSFDAAATWHALERTDNVIRILVAGPLATGDLSSAVVLSGGRNEVVVRVTTGSQAIIRNGGVVDIEV